MSPCSRSGRCRRGANSQSRQVLNHRVVGGNFLNHSEVNVSGNDAARGIRPSNVRRTDSRSHGKVSYTPARSPQSLGSEFRTQSAPSGWHHHAFHGHYGTTRCSVVAPASHKRAGPVNRGGRAAEIGYVVEGGGCSHPRLGCWYRRATGPSGKPGTRRLSCRGGWVSSDEHGLVDRLTKADHPETVDLSLCRGVCRCVRAGNGWCK